MSTDDWRVPDYTAGLCLDKLIIPRKEDLATEESDVLVVAITTVYISAFPKQPRIHYLCALSRALFSMVAAIERTVMTVWFRICPVCHVV